MQRRTILIVAILCLVAVAAAVAPWTLSSGAVTAAIATQLRDAYGLELAPGGRRTIAFLPVPRLKFEDISLSAFDGTPVVQGGQLRGEFRLLPLLVGRLELADVAINGARIDLSAGPGERQPLALTLAKLRERAEGGSSAAHVRRLTVTNSTVSIRDFTAGSEIRLRDVNLVVNWPNADGTLEVAGSLRWRGEPIAIAVSDVVPSAVLAGQPTQFAVDLKAAGARLTASGKAEPSQTVKFAGHAAFQARSLRDFMYWSGLGMPLGSLVQAISGDGEFTADDNGISWPSIRMTLGSDRLDGALALRWNGQRAAVTGTLAAGKLDLTQILAPLSQMRTAWGSWSAEPFDLGPATGGDLDLRLSATSARVGTLHLDDMAANLLVKQGRVEATLGRATMAKGVVKGRLAVAQSDKGAEVRLHGSFDHLDADAALDELGQTRWLSGTAQGQVALEGAGVSPFDLLRNIGGKASVSVRQGEIVGVALGDWMRRLERRPLSASLDWRGGRTPFDQAATSLAVVNGTCDLAEGSLTSPAIRAALDGRISLVERAVAVQAKVESLGAGSGSAPNPVMSFDIAGSFDDVAITPDIRALIQRSGAARPLLGFESNAVIRQDAGQ